MWITIVIQLFITGEKTFLHVNKIEGMEAHYVDGTVSTYSHRNCTKLIHSVIKIKRYGLNTLLD